MSAFGSRRRNIVLTDPWCGATSHIRHSGVNADRSAVCNVGEGRLTGLNGS